MSKLLRYEDLSEEFILEKRMIMDPSLFDRWFRPIKDAKRDFYIPVEYVGFPGYKHTFYVTQLENYGLLYEGVQYARLAERGYVIDYAFAFTQGSIGRPWAEELIDALNGKKSRHESSDFKLVFNPDA